MNDQEILNLIRKALSEVAPGRESDFENLSLDQTIEGLALDSIATMEMVGVLEEEIDATFADDELAQVQKVGDLARLVRQNKNAA